MLYLLLQPKILQLYFLQVGFGLAIARVGSVDVVIGQNEVFLLVLSMA